VRCSLYAILSSSNGSNSRRMSTPSASAIFDNVSNEKVFLHALLDSIFLINS